MYAIAFDIDTAALQAAYPNPSYKNAYAQIATELKAHGFTRQQGSVYFGDATVTAVTTVLAVQSVAAKYAWFSKMTVSDVRMLRIEEDNDLSVALP